MDQNDLDNRFDYHRPEGPTIYRHEGVRENCKDLAIWLNSTLPEGREKSLAITKLEEVMFWSNAAIARQ